MNCWNTLRARKTTARGGSLIAKVKNFLDWAISIQAAMIVTLLVAIPAEGSTTIPSGSRVQADSKCATPATQGEDIVSAPAKAERGSAEAAESQGNCFWYEWRVSIHALTANLNTEGTAYVFEALQRIRRLGAAKYLATQNPLVTVSLVDLVSYIDSFQVSTTMEQTTTITNFIGFRGGKTMTVGGKPYKINPTCGIAA